MVVARCTHQMRNYVQVIVILNSPVSSALRHLEATQPLPCSSRDNSKTSTPITNLNPRPTNSTLKTACLNLNSASTHIHWSRQISELEIPHESYKKTEEWGSALIPFLWIALLHVGDMGVLGMKLHTPNSGHRTQNPYNFSNLTNSSKFFSWTSKQHWHCIHL